MTFWLYMVWAIAFARSPTEVSCLRSIENVDADFFKASSVRKIKVDGAVYYSNLGPGDNLSEISLFKDDGTVRYFTLRKAPQSAAFSKHLIQFPFSERVYEYLELTQQDIAYSGRFYSGRANKSVHRAREIRVSSSDQWRNIANALLPRLGETKFYKSVARSPLGRTRLKDLLKNCDQAFSFSDMTVVRQNVERRSKGSPVPCTDTVCEDGAKDLLSRPEYSPDAETVAPPIAQ